MKRRVSEFKKWLSSVVIIAMLFTCFPISTWAESEVMVEVNGSTDVNSANEDDSENVPEKGSKADNTVAVENAEARSESVSAENDDANNESTPTESTEASGESTPVESADASNESTPADNTGLGIESVPEENVGANSDSAAESVDVSNVKTPVENTGADTDSALTETADVGSESTSTGTAGADAEEDPVESIDANSESTLADNTGAENESISTENTSASNEDTPVEDTDAGYDDAPTPDTETDNDDATNSDTEVSNGIAPTVDTDANDKSDSDAEESVEVTDSISNTSTPDEGMGDTNRDEVSEGVSTATEAEEPENTSEQTEEAIVSDTTEEIIVSARMMKAMAKGSSGVSLSLGYGSSGNDRAYEDISFTITWNKMEDADHYEVSVRDLTTGSLLYDHEVVGSGTRRFTISARYMIADHSYRVWVGAAVDGVEGFQSTHQAQGEFTCYAQSCSHKNGTYRDVTKKKYKSISDTEHRYTEYYNLRCNDCDEIIEADLTETGTEDHFLDDNGDCKLCDYTFSCDHSKTKIVIENTGYSTKDETYHLYFETGHVVCKNALCQKVLEPYYYEEDQEHTFVDGECSKCGYVKAEELSIIVARGSANATSGENISANVTIKGGTGTYAIAWEVLCNGSAKYKTDYTMPSEYSYQTDEAGNWQFKVYVKDKGDNKELTATTDNIVVAEAECAHTETEEELIETEYSIASDTNHQVKEYYRVVCKKCGEVINERFYKTRMESHTVDESGKCICGYVAPTEECDHATSEEKEIDSYPEQYNEKWHYVVTVYQDVCANCGVVLNERREVRNFEAHSFNTEGICTICNYVRPNAECDHAPTKTELSTSYEPIDREYHNVNTVYHYECNCGQINYDEPSTRKEQHTLVGGKCTICGYEAETDITIDGAFGKSSYTMKAGGSLDVGVTASTTNANLTRVTVNVDASGNDRLASKEISGTSWDGNLTLDGTVAPLNTPGTYTLKLYVAVDSGDPNYAQVDTATLVVEEAIETTIGKPDVTVTVDGATMTATWGAVEGAARYVYSLRNTTDDQLIANHVETTSPLSLTLDAGKSYRLAVGAVPAGVDDVANPDKCGWDQDEFSIATETTIGKPDVTVTVDGATMTATWGAVEGAARYVYSLRNTTDDQLIANHVETTSPLSLTLDAGKSYRLAVGAVPAGVDDVANPDKCGWDQDEFSIASVTPTLTITSPVANTEVPFGKELVVEWTAVDQADHYDFSARYNDETVPIINRAKTNEERYQINAGQLKLGKKLNLWVGACDTNGQVIDGTVQATVTVTIANMGKPDVTIDVDELNLLATWPVVEGAARYVYSLRNVTDDVPLVDHEDATSRTITQILQAGKEYRLAVGAVPAGVDDVTNAASCSWTEMTFDTMPAVVGFTVEPNPVMLGKEATFKVYNQRTEKVKLIVDGIEYEEYAVNSDPQIVKRTFSQAGKRNVQFKAFGGGVWGDPCDAVQLEVLPAGKVPDPVISNISDKEILLSDNRTVYWRVEGDEESLGIDYYAVTLARLENGTWTPVYVVNTTDDQEASGGGISLSGLLDVPGNYRLMVIAVPYGEGMDSELTGRASVEFGYRTVPEFSLTEIVNDETIGTPVTVKWNRPIWGNNDKQRPDKYIVWWYGPGMENGMAVEIPGSSTKAILAGDYCKQPGGYAVGIYAILGEQQSYASGNNEFEKATPEVSIETKKGPYLTTEQFYAIGSTKGGIKYVRVQLEKDGGAELVSLIGADGNPCEYIVVSVDPDTKKYMALLKPVNELIENGTYAIAVYGFFSEADANDTNLRADSKYIMLTINGSKMDRVDLLGGWTSENVTATWRYTNTSLQVRAHGNNAMKNMVVSWSGGSANQQKTENDGEWNQWLYSSPFSFSSSGKVSLTIDVDGKKKYATVYIVRPQSGTRYASKDSVAVTGLPGGNIKKTIGLNDSVTIKGEYGDYWLVDAGGSTGFVLKGDVSPNRTIVEQPITTEQDIPLIGTESKPIELPSEKEIKDWIKKDGVGDDGYLLLEMMLDDNNNGQLFKFAKTVWNGGLEVLQLDFFTMGKHVIEHFNYDNKIQEILLDSYVQYMNEKGTEIEAIETDDAFRETLSMLAKNKKYHSLFQKVMKEMGVPESLDVTKLDDITKYIYGMKMNDTEKLALLLDKYGSDFLSSDVDFINMRKEYEDWKHCLPQLRTIEAALTETAFSVIDIYKFATDYKQSYYKHENMVKYMCYVNEDFMNMLNKLEDVAKEKCKTEYHQYHEYLEAIENFRGQFMEVANKNIDNVVRDYAVSDTGYVVQTKIAKLGYDITLEVLKRYNIKLPKTGWVGIGASLVSSGAEMTDYLSPNKKDEILDNMIYIRTLKSLLGDTIDGQLNEYDGVTQSKASEIQASLLLMKSLMTRGENESLKLLKMITASTYIYQPWHMVIESNGIKYYSTNSVDPTSDSIDAIKDELEANGAKIGFVRIVDESVPQGAGDANILKEYSDFVKGSDRKVLGKYNDEVSFMSGGIVEEGDIVDVDSAKKLSEGDIEYVNQQLEKIKEDPKYYQYWEDFVNSYSRRRIEKLKF